MRHAIASLHRLLPLRVLALIVTITLVSGTLAACTSPRPDNVCSNVPRPFFASSNACPTTSMPPAKSREGR